MKTKYYLFINFFVLLTSCDPGVDLEYTPIENLYSITSFISPQDTLLVAYVFKAQEVGSIAFSDTAIFKDAEVIISNGTSADTLFYNQDFLRYQARRKNLVIEELGMYTLEVKINENIILHASCTIPPTPELPQMTGAYVNDDYNFRIEWENPQGWDYYTLTPYSDGTYEVSTPFGIRKYQISANLTDGIKFPSKDQLTLNTLNGYIGQAKVADNPKITFYLRNIEENLYKYFASYASYEAWSSNSSGSLIPSFQEPQSVYSNIEGGVGIFAGYNQTTLIIDL